MGKGRIIKVKNILWISPIAPYDTIAHAGGKSENYFLKGVNKDSSFHVFLITCMEAFEKEKLDLDKYQVAADVIEYDRTKLELWKRRLMNLESKINPWNRNAQLIQNYTEYMLKKAIARYATGNRAIDIVILQWTQCVLLTAYVKRIFPDAKIVAIEEDVAFLGYERKYLNANHFMKREWCRLKYKKLKRKEAEALKKTDYIWVYTDKDAKLLEKEGIAEDSIHIFSGYYDDYSNTEYCRRNNDIVFYGAMNRRENYEAAIWFIENVFYRIKNSRSRFIAAGANPPPQLMKYASDRIVITGFVENVASIFSEAMCLVAPLKLGAGIKIKILEALSAGIPVLTTHVGIEGIPARDGKEYFLCESAEDYIRAINLLLDDVQKGYEMSCSSKEFMKNHFNKEESLKRFISDMNRI